MNNRDRRSPAKNTKKSIASNPVRAGSPNRPTNSVPLQAISAKEFVGRFAHGVKEHGQSFTLFLGAGCSVTSGISDAGSLVRKWLGELHDLQSTENFEDWLVSAFPSFDTDNPALLYAKVFERRHPSPVERQREIEMICSAGEPAYGYATLAQLLSHRDYGRLCNTVLTTNFDDLIADALYLYGERHARPLVVTHEALARYVRTNSQRPTIVKLHGDAHLDPKNLQPETREIDASISAQLYPFLQNHALVFFGYGGNDQSILRFVENCPVPALAPPIYWVSRREPPSGFANWLRKRNALRVDHTDFDELMHLLRNALSLELLDQHRWNRISEVYYLAFERLKKGIQHTKTASAHTEALHLATSAAEKTLPDEWHFHLQANDVYRRDPDKAVSLYKKGLDQFPKSRLLNEMYAVFLADTLKHLDAAETHFKMAMAIDPNNASTLGNYATFLMKERNNLDGAEAYFKQALSADPQHAKILSNYASLLLRRRNLDAAEAHYRRALEVDPNAADVLNNYANFLVRERKDANLAETFYKRGIEAAPNDAGILANYANFLVDVRKDPKAADSFYKRAMQIFPDNAIILGNYANFLNDEQKDADTAESYFKRALEADPTSAFTLSSFAIFMQNEREDLTTAEALHKRAIAADPSDPDVLGNYAQLVLATGRKNEGIRMLDQASGMVAGEREAVLIEMLVYRYVHDGEKRDAALQQLYTLLADGVRIPKWDFSLTMKFAGNDSDLNLSFLDDLVSVVTNTSPLSVLERHKEWQSVKPSDEKAE